MRQRAWVVILLLALATVTWLATLWTVASAGRLQPRTAEQPAAPLPAERERIGALSP